MSLRVPILIALCTTGAIAAEMPAGVAAAPTPGAMPEAWGALGNDDFGRTGHSGDDHRTNQTMVGGRVGGSALIAIDHSMLTDRAGGTRSDELTATAAWLPFGDGGDAGHRLELGGGVRDSGRLFGEALQNDCHRARDFRPVYLEYERGAVTAVVYGDALARASHALRDDLSATAEIEAAGVVTSWVSAQAELAVRGVLHWTVDDVRAWTGVRARFTDAGGQSQTARATAEFERGVWIDYGASWRMWSLSGGIDTRNGYSYGEVGLSVKHW